MTKCVNPHPYAPKWHIAGEIYRYDFPVQSDSKEIGPLITIRGSSLEVTSVCHDLPDRDETAVSNDIIVNAYTYNRQHKVGPVIHYRP